LADQKQCELQESILPRPGWKPGGPHFLTQRQ